MIKDLFQLPSSKQATIILTVVLICPTGSLVLYLLNTKLFHSLDVFRFVVMCIMYVFPFAVFNYIFLLPLNKFGEKYTWLMNNKDKITMDPPPIIGYNETNYYEALNGSMIMTAVTVYSCLVVSYVASVVLGDGNKMFNLTLRKYFLFNIIVPSGIYILGLISALSSDKEMKTAEEKYIKQTINIDAKT